MAEQMETPTWAEFLAKWVDLNMGSDSSFLAWEEYQALLHQSPPVDGCECRVCVSLPRKPAAPPVDLTALRRELWGLVDWLEHVRTLAVTSDPPDAYDAGRKVAFEQAADALRRKLTKHLPRATEGE